MRSNEARDLWFGVIVLFMWAGFALVLTVTAGCVRVVKPQPQTVSIVYKPAMPSCYVQEMPEPPKLLEADYEETDIQRRVFVHFLTGNEIIQYEQELATWAGQVRECLMMMQGVTP